MITFGGCIALCLGLFAIVRRHVNHLYRKADELSETTHNQQCQIDELKRELEEMKR